MNRSAGNRVSCSTPRGKAGTVFVASFGGRKNCPALLRWPSRILSYRTFLSVESDGFSQQRFRDVRDSRQLFFNDPRYALLVVFVGETNNRLPRFDKRLTRLTDQQHLASALRLLVKTLRDSVCRQVVELAGVVLGILATCSLNVHRTERRDKAVHPITSPDNTFIARLD